MPHREAIEQAHTLVEILERRKQKKKHTNVAFTDLAKAYDSVSHLLIFNKLHNINLPSYLL